MLYSLYQFFKWIKMGQKIGEIVVIIQQYGRFDGETPPF